MYNFLDSFAFRVPQPVKAAVALLAVTALAGCAETEEAADFGDSGSFVTTQPDAYVPPSYSGGPTVGNPSFPDSTPSYPDASVDSDAGFLARYDAGGSFNLDDLFAMPEAGTSGPVGNPGKGELDPNGAIDPKRPPKADNPKECPSLAPPNPVGGCLGLPIYLFCSYGAPNGPQYTCTCDWYHWLCV